MSSQSALPFIAGIFVGLLIAAFAGAVTGCAGLWWWFSYRDKDSSPAKLLAEVLPDPNSKEAEDLLDSATGTLSIGKIKAIAENAAYRKAGRAR